MSFLGDIFGGGGKATLRHFAIGSFTLDVITEENFQKTWTKSESAVESGARISDHRTSNPSEIMIRGTVVNYEIYDFVDEVFPELNPLLAKIDLPVQVSAVTDYTIATVNRYAGTVRKYANIANRTINTIGKISSISSLSDIPSLLNDTSSTDDRITRIKKTLEAIGDSETLIEVVTSTGVYKNVQIGGVSVTRPDHGNAEFTILLSEIPTYDVQVVGGIDAKIKTATNTSGKSTKEPTKPTGKNKSERSATQSATPQNKGKTTPQKSNKSALKTIVDSAKGFI